jgi:protein-S-isoprenylcysteine O-methyltransferase Ste14
MTTFDLVIGLLIPEEGRMRETFPEYEEYARGTAAIVPYVY